MGEPTSAIELAGSSVETYAFPGRSADPVKAYWYASASSGNARSLLRLRYDEEQAAWTRLATTPEEYAASPSNDKHVVYDAPVYAPASGVIVSCWRRAPENLWPGEPHPGRTSSPRQIFAAGNHVNILTDDNRVILLANFRTDTVPLHLCPLVGDAQGLVVNADDKIGEFPVEAVIPLAQRPRVEQGELVGRVGNSGASSAPHLSTHLKPVIGMIGGELAIPDMGASIPFPFHGVYTQVPGASNDDVWLPLLDAEIPLGQLLHASPYLLRDDAPDLLSVRETATVSFEGGFAAVLLRDGSVGVRIRSYRAPAGALELVDEEVVGTGTQLAMMRFGTGRQFITAMRDGNGNLKLQRWELTATGAIVLRGAGSGGPIQLLALAASPSGTGLVTAVRDATTFKLKVITWSVGTPQADQITSVAEAIGDTAGEVKIATMHTPFQGVVTATRDGFGRLRIDTFSMTGLSITKLDQETTTHTADRVSVKVVPTGISEHLVAAMRDDAGRLRLNMYGVASGTGQITPISTEAVESADPVTSVDLQSMRGHDVASLTTDMWYRLRVINWRLFDDGRIEHHGEMTLGSVAGCALSEPALTDDWRDLVIGAIRKPGNPGALLLTAWQYTN